MAKLPKGKPVHSRDDEQTAALEDVISGVAQEVEGITEEPLDSGENPETAPPSDEEVVVVSKPERNKTVVSRVKVATVCDHSCYIGGVPYHFKRGVIAYVPAPVKDILRNAGLLQAI